MCDFVCIDSAHIAKVSLTKSLFLSIPIFFHVPLNIEKIKSKSKELRGCWYFKFVALADSE